MPKVHNWEDWDEDEEWVKREQSRIKTNGKVNEKNKKFQYIKKIIQLINQSIV